jgi:hypothetical protein
MQFNVIAIVDKEQIAIPYKPVTLKVPSRKVFGGMWLVLVLIGVVLLFGVMAFYFFLRGRKL